MHVLTLNDLVYIDNEHACMLAGCLQFFAIDFFAIIFFYFLRLMVS